MQARSFWILTLLFTCTWISAQSIMINRSLEIVDYSSAITKYNNEFGRYNNPELDEPFPYAIIRMALEGDAQQIRIAKQKLQLDLGTMYKVAATDKNTSNEILFLVPTGARIINIVCGDGCEKQTLWSGSLRPDAVYTCQISFTPEEAAPSSQMAEMMKMMQTMQQQLDQMSKQQLPEEEHESSIATEMLDPTIDQVRLPKWFLDIEEGIYVGISMPNGSLDQAVHMALIQYFLSTNQQCNIIKEDFSRGQDYEEKHVLGKIILSANYTILQQETLRSNEIICRIRVGAGTPVRMIGEIYCEQEYNAESGSNWKRRIIQVAAEDHTPAEWSFYINQQWDDFDYKYQYEGETKYEFSHLERPIEYIEDGIESASSDFQTVFAPREDIECLGESLLDCYLNMLENTHGTGNVIRTATPIRHIRVRDNLTRVY